MDVPRRHACNDLQSLSGVEIEIRLVHVHGISAAVEHRREHDFVRNGFCKSFFTDDNVDSCVNQAVAFLSVFEINRGSALRQTEDFFLVDGNESASAVNVPRKRLRHGCIGKSGYRGRKQLVLFDFELVNGIFLSFTARILARFFGVDKSAVGVAYKHRFGIV